ncbi:uncharacterized protein LOC107413184 [Ziziphus jujuba]|uniref:Uncharacterized protein LOC107413184 n=2 Tax=Ziziphus jujuba TaxID=326968 RepID=A0A6P3ZSP2_ZIZJJ|nr:uncharacterized protein LOC107413184 [Ziziphus jujuba]KAH7536997.1 hypothetical protein FEM48_Zijuj03G0045200 [Ziziphus jujuba var. spinosa]
MEKPEGYPEVATENASISNYGNSSPFWVMEDDDDLSLLESGLFKTYHIDDEMGDNDYESKIRKLVDPRLLALVEFFRELYFRKRDLFKRIFPGFQDEFRELLKKLSRLKSDRTKAMQRSLSLGSPRKPKAVQSTLRLERFKVRTITLDGGDDQQGDMGINSTTTKSQGSK